MVCPQWCAALERNEVGLNRFGWPRLPFVPAQAGTQSQAHRPEPQPWVPACAGTNGRKIAPTQPHHTLAQQALVGAELLAQDTFVEAVARIEQHAERDAVIHADLDLAHRTHRGV